MIISEDSPLRRIPAILDRRQTLFIEGICFSVDMADVAYNRLRRTLLLLPTLQHEHPEVPSTVSSILDAWCIVDCLNRLRHLVQNMPGSKGKSKDPQYRMFMAATDKIPDLRNTMQHLDGSIRNAADDLNWAVLGSLAWGVIDPGKNQVKTCVFMPGIAMGSRPMINPLDRTLWHVPIDSITIERGGVSVGLSDAMRRVAALAHALEKYLARAFAEHIPDEDRRKTHAANVVLGLSILTVASEQIVSEDTPDPEPELPPALDEDEVEAAAPIR